MDIWAHKDPKNDFGIFFCGREVSKQVYEPIYSKKTDPNFQKCGRYRLSVLMSIKRMRVAIPGLAVRPVQRWLPIGHRAGGGGGEPNIHHPKWIPFLRNFVSRCGWAWRHQDFDDLEQRHCRHWDHKKSEVGTFSFPDMKEKTEMSEQIFTPKKSKLKQTPEDLSVCRALGGG
jgi:hypothetical protein